MTNEQLKNYDIVLLLDKSGSMSTNDMPGGRSRWDAAKELTIAVANKCVQFDQDGITVIPFAGSFKRYDNVTGTDVVEKIFNEQEPQGSTDTAKVVKSVLDGYFADRKKPVIVLCVTDGTPDDQKALSSVIIEATKKMEKDEEIGISFFQIGSDPAATKFLKSLDDDLTSQGAKFDIVDTKTTEELENMTITEAVLAALND
jgi:Mg-chelatase subunit ChlD